MIAAVEPKSVLCFVDYFSMKIFFVTFNHEYLIEIILTASIDVTRTWLFWSIF